MASIIVISGRQEGDYYPLGHRTNVIGRAEANPIQILDDLVSRKHMQIRFDKEANCFFALDMKSTHGVFINGRRIRGEAHLSDGDHIRIGHTDMLFTLGDFTDRESAMSHYKKVGERIRTTLISDRP